MQTPHRFLSDLPRNPWSRALALVLALVLSGCFATKWEPIPKPPNLSERMNVRITPGGVASGRTWTHPRTIVLVRPWMEGDSIIAGQTPSGVFVVDSADERIPVGRYRLDHTYVAASKHFSAPRTLLVV